MIQNLFAGLGLLICLALLLRMMLPAARQRSVDARAQRAWQACRRTALRIRSALTQWRRDGRTSKSKTKSKAAPQQPARDAAEMAEEAIRRARGEVTREGNVYKPKSFRQPRKPH